MQSTVLLSLKSLDVPITWETFKSTSAPSLSFVCTLTLSMLTCVCKRAHTHMCTYNCTQAYERAGISFNLVD